MNNSFTKRNPHRRRIIFGLLALPLAAAAFFALCVLTVVLAPPDGIPILEYHMVDLQREGYTTITLLDYLRAKKGKQELPEKPIILTFDDGYEDNYTQMLPLLEARGMRAVVFVVTNDIGLPDYLTWDELRDMSRRGIEIGSHTANHQPLTTMSEAEQQEEMHLSKLLLEWNGLPTVYTFSYPNGAYDASMPARLQENEYLAAVTGDAGLNTFANDPYLLQRVNIPHPRFGLLEFRLRLIKAELFARFGVRQHLVAAE